MERTETPIMVLVLKMAETSTISIVSPTFGFITWERKTHHFYFGWVTTFPVSLQQLRVSTTNPRPFRAVGNDCFCSPITVSLDTLLILVLGVGGHIWLSRYPYISRGLPSAQEENGLSWTWKGNVVTRRLCFLYSGQAQTAKSQAFQ